MAAYYDSIKSMKTAKIGTILPWGGDGGTGFLASNIPVGWIVCDGDQSIPAKDYPLLASMIMLSLSIKPCFKNGIKGNNEAVGKQPGHATKLASDIFL